jgi:uroporphyrinogen decarboxylase
VNSRQRVIAALNHQTPDRIPRDLGGTESSGITGIAYNRLREHLGLEPAPPRIFDVYQQIGLVDDQLRAAFGIDTVPLTYEPRRWRPFHLADGSPCLIPAGWDPKPDRGGLVVRDAAGKAVARMPAGGLYFEPVDFPLADVSDPAELDAHAEEIEGFDLPAMMDEGWDSLTERARRLHTETDRAVVGNFLAHLLAAGQSLRRYDNFLVDLMVNQRLARAILERLTDAYCRRAETYLGAVGPYIDVILVNDDLGTQNGPMLSPDVYREMILPYQKRLFGFIKQRANVPLLLHSCGSVRAFIPDLIEAGVDALNPIQVSAAGMDTAELKRQFGRDLVFWGGGCDTQQVLCRLGPDEVRTEVRRRAADLSAGGGFVFTQVHNIQPDVPPENIRAMYAALDELAP